MRTGRLILDFISDNLHKFLLIRVSRVVLAGLTNFKQERADER